MTDKIFNGALGLIEFCLNPVKNHVNKIKGANQLST